MADLVLSSPMFTITILTKNSAATLKETLESVSSFPEVVILDTGSTDATLDIARAFPNVKIFVRPFSGFGPAHNEASSLASSNWIVSLDSDEVVTPELAAEIKALAPLEGVVYSFLRDNYFNGKRIRCCSGWYPDPVLRIYNRKTTRFSDDAVHERVLTEGLKIVPLKHSVRHTPYRNINDILAKMQNYTTLFAEQNRHKKRSSFAHAVLHGSFSFLKSYFLKRGFLGGKEGFIISLFMGQTAFYKYLKLAELNKSSHV